MQFDFSVEHSLSLKERKVWNSMEVSWDRLWTLVGTLAG